jgi:hypothetical protein
METHSTKKSESAIYIVVAGCDQTSLRQCPPQTRSGEKMQSIIVSSLCSFETWIADEIAQ